MEILGEILIAVGQRSANSCCRLFRSVRLFKQPSRLAYTCPISVYWNLRTLLFVDSSIVWPHSDAA